MFIMNFKTLWKLHGKKPCYKCNNPNVYSLVPIKNTTIPVHNIGYWRSNRREFRKTFGVLCESCLKGMMQPNDQHIADETSLYYSGYDNVEQMLKDKVNLAESGYDTND